jgi:hypothetical protein
VELSVLDSRDHYKDQVLTREDGSCGLTVGCHNIIRVADLIDGAVSAKQYLEAVPIGIPKHKEYGLDHRTAQNQLMNTASANVTEFLKKSMHGYIM